MRIFIYLYASYASYLPRGSTGNSCTREVADGVLVSQVLKDMGIPLDTPKIIFVNGRHASDDTILKSGDRLAVFPPIAGG